MKQSCLRMLFALAFALAASTGYSQPWPAKPVHIVVPFPPGGVVDGLGRALAERLSQRLGQPVVVENKPGANTIIAAKAVSDAEPDGHTLLMATDVTMSVLPFLYKKLPFDPARDLAPVSMIAYSTPFLVVSQGVGAASVADVVRIAKDRPGTLGYGSQGLGSNGHLAGETFRQLAGIEITHVPYKGLADVYNALLGNHIQVAFANIFPAIGHVRDGRIKALAVAGPTRSPLLPDVPTLAEAGYPQLESMAWFGLVAPARTPAAVIDRLSSEVRKIVAEPAFQDRHIGKVGLQPAGNAPDEFKAFLEKDRRKYEVQVRNAGVKLD